MFQIGDQVIHNQTIEIIILNLAYNTVRSGIPYKRTQMSPDSTSGIDLEDYNGNSRINLKADTINFSWRGRYE